TGSRRSPAGSTWCTATTHGTSSVPAGTGTPTSRPGRSTPPCCSAWSAPRAPRSSARPPTRTAAWPPTSAGCRSGWALSPPGRPPEPEHIARSVEYATGRIVETPGAHYVPFGPENIPHHVGGEQAYGEKPGRQGGEVPSRADPLVAGYQMTVSDVDEDEEAPD